MDKICRWGCSKKRHYPRFQLAQVGWGQLGMVIEFESKIAAKRAFYSDVFQNYLKSRDLMELVTISTL